MIRSTQQPRMRMKRLQRSAQGEASSDTAAAGLPAAGQQHRSQAELLPGKPPGGLSAALPHALASGFEPAAHCPMHAHASLERISKPEGPQCSTRSRSLVEPGGHGVLASVLWCEVVLINHVKDVLVALRSEQGLVEGAQPV